MKKHHRSVSSLLPHSLLFFLLIVILYQTNKRSNLSPEIFYNTNQPYQALYTRLQQIASSCPTAKLESIAKTHQKRPIPILRIGSSNPHASTLLLTAGMHGRERLTTLNLLYTVETLCDRLQQTSSQNSYSSALSQIRILIVPMLNPDGLSRGSEIPPGKQQKNGRPPPSVYRSKCPLGGVNLNHNWPMFWAKGNGISKHPCHDRYVGPAPLSEPETAGLTRVILNHPKIHMAIDLHLYGAFLLRGWAYSASLSPQTELEERQKLIARAMRMAVKREGGTEFHDVNAAFLMTRWLNRTFGGTYHDFMMQRGIPCITLGLTPKHSNETPYNRYHADHEILTQCKEVELMLWTAIHAVHDESTIPHYSDKQLGLILP